MHHLVGFYAREFKEAWYSGEDNAINRHIDIPTIYLPLKTIRNIATNKDTNASNTNVENLPTSATHQSSHSTILDNEEHSSMTTHLSTTVDQ